MRLTIWLGMIGFLSYANQVPEKNVPDSLVVILAIAAILSLAQDVKELFN